jgi:hypothetical protein
MEEEKNALDELLFIKKVIQDSRKIVVDNGMGFIVWGILITFGMICGYIKFLLDLKFDYMWVWIVLIAVGWTYSFFTFYRKKGKRVQTFVGRTIGCLWFSFGVSMTIIGFGGYYTNAIAGWQVSSIIAVLLGAAYYLSSVIYEWKWFKLIGLLWWVGSFVLFYVNGIEQFLVMACLLTLGQVLPGVILYRKSKQQLSEAK